MFNHNKVFVLLVLFTISGIAKELSGELTDSMYIFNESVVVQANDTLIIRPGCKLYFNQYCQLEIFGTLICDGKADDRILLSSANEMIKGRKPEAMDWNGVRIYKNSNYVSIKNTDINYSTFGVDIEDEETKVLIFNLVFNNSGLDLFTIGREKKIASEKDPIFYSSGFKSIFKDQYQTILPGQKVVKSGGYYIDEMLNIEEGDTMIIEGPSTIFFGDNASIRVNGSLFINQTTNATVHLTSVNAFRNLSEGERIPLPGDWLGVCVSKKANTVKIKNCKIEYSKVGFNFEDLYENNIEFENMNYGIYNGDIQESGNIELQESAFYE